MFKIKIIAMYYTQTYTRKLCCRRETVDAVVNIDVYSLALDIT